ncbi:MAG: S66 peptidase family protein [Streptosporangiaceae bacterium]
MSEPLGARVRPRRLRAGDRVAVVAPSGPVDRKRLEAGREVLASLGLDVVLAEHATDLSGFLAGDDRDRAADLQRAWCHPEVRAVICARGGYGAGRVLPHLDWQAMSAAGPTLLHGSSDATALHSAVAARLGVVTTFGPMVANSLLGRDDPDFTSMAHLRDTLFAPERVQTVHAKDGRAAVRGRARGPVTGGTLSLLAAAVGTPYRPPPARGCIALLEDVDEAPYRVDRMLTQLLQSGWLEGVAGVALGSWIDCGDAEEVEAVLSERLGPLGVPVLSGLPVGHGIPQLTVPLGVEAELDADAGTLVFIEPALA